MNQEDQDYIENYIRENRSTYTREAITEQLIKFGYSVEAIRRGWASLLVADHDGPGRTVRKQAEENFGCGMILTILGWGLIPAILIFFGYQSIISTHFAGMTFRERYYNAENALFEQRINLLFVVLVIGVFLVAAFLRTRGWSSTRILALGCAVTFALVFIVLGSCMVGGISIH